VARGAARCDGAVLRSWRRSRGWDVPEMARRLRAAAREAGQSAAAHEGLARMVYAWERGDHTLTERYALLYSRALDVAPDELAGGPPGMAVDLAGGPVGVGGPVSSVLPLAGGEDGEDPVKRREFGVAVAMSAMSLLEVLQGHSAELPERVACGSRVDGEAAAGLANVVLGYRQIYQSAGAGSLLEPVCGTLGLLTELAPRAGAYRDQIVSLIGQAGSLTAVMLILDRGDYAAGLRYLALGARAAQQNGDRELLSITMATRAFHASYSGDPVDGLAFAREAVSIASRGAHPRTYGWVSAVESEMYATVGDEAGYRRSIETAQAQVTAPMPDSPWKGIGAFSPAKVTAYRGAGLMRLRRYDDAQLVLLQALSQLDQVQAKHRCTAHIDLADAYVRDSRPKPDEAAHHAASALDILAVTGHAESMKRVAGIYERVRPSGTPAVRELGSRLLEVRAASVF
jgi:hypothetical protein